jgi:hypothetical protein
MASTKLVEGLAEAFIHDVRDGPLQAATHHLFGTWARTDENAIHAGLVSKLDENQKDLLWRLMTEMVEQTIDRTLRFVDHKYVTGQVRVHLKDLETGEQEVLLDDKSLDLPNEYWFEWLERFAQLHDRPTSPSRP